MVTQRSRSWSWIIDSHPFSSVSVGYIYRVITALNCILYCVHTFLGHWIGNTETDTTVHIFGLHKMSGICLPTEISDTCRHYGMKTRSLLMAFYIRVIHRLPLTQDQSCFRLSHCQREQAIGKPSYFFLVFLTCPDGHVKPLIIIVRAAHCHDDVIKWKHSPRYWHFVRGIHRSPVNSPHKGQWRGALMFSLICAWINYRINNLEAGDLRRHHTHYDFIVMLCWAETHLRVAPATLKTYLDGPSQI